MKNFILISLLLITGIQYGQLNTEPPKIITEINKKVEWINSIHDSSSILVLKDSNSSHYLKREVTITGNQTVRISEYFRPWIGTVKTKEYYFNNNKLIYGIKQEYTIAGVFTDSFYYDYDELVSKPELLFTEYDTIYIHVQLQQEGYNLFKEYCHYQNYNPFANLEYNRVVAYDYEGRGGRKIVNNSQLDKSAILPGKVLSAELQELLVNSITDSSNYGGSTAGCFDPRLGIVFYMNDSIVAHVSICFECNFLASNIYLPAEVHNRQVDSGDDYYFVRPLKGFSPQGRKLLKQLCHELGLSKCPDLNETAIWDSE